jgi:hypothetical protein
LLRDQIRELKRSVGDAVPAAQGGITYGKSRRPRRGKKFAGSRG